MCVSVTATMRSGSAAAAWRQASTSRLGSRTMASCVSVSPSRKLAWASDSSKKRLRIMGATAAASGGLRKWYARQSLTARAGDDGTTGLLGRARVAKHDARVEAYGSVDELNAALGVAHALDPERGARGRSWRARRPHGRGRPEAPGRA